MTLVEDRLLEENGRNAIITFDRGEPTFVAEGVHNPRRREVPTGSDGSFSVELPPGVYWVTLPGADRPKRGVLSESDTPVSLALMLGSGVLEPNALQVLIDSYIANNYGVTKRVLPTGKSLIIAEDESLVVAGYFEVQGTLTVLGGFAVVDTE